MANCHGCYWADRHPETRIQVEHKEPDFLANIKPGKSPPDVRVVKSCGAGAKFYKSYGRQQHNCSHFIDQAEASEEENAEIAEKRAKWCHRTSRYQLPATQNMLLIIERMTLGSNEAFDILLELMSTEPDKMAGTITCLDDMNIRGGQITLAYRFSGKDMQRLIKNAHERNPAMVSYINKHYIKADMEEAVQRGAHLYGHKVK